MELSLILTRNALINISLGELWYAIGTIFNTVDGPRQVVCVASEMNQADEGVRGPVIPVWNYRCKCRKAMTEKWEITFQSDILKRQHD